MVQEPACLSPALHPTQTAHGTPPRLVHRRMRLDRRPWLTTTGPSRQFWLQHVVATWCSSSSTCQDSEGRQEERGLGASSRQSGALFPAANAHHVVLVIAVLHAGMPAARPVTVAGQVQHLNCAAQQRCRNHGDLFAWEKPD